MTVTDILANPGVLLFLLLSATLLLSYVANYCLARIFIGQTYRYLIAPGVVVHEYSHALACVLTGARIKEVRLFEAAGGRVVHGEPRLPFAQGLISVAPIFGAGLVIYLLARLLVPSFIGFGELEISSWQFLVFAYVAGSVAAAMAPSRQDLTVGLASFLVICAVIGLGSLSTLVSDYFQFLGGDVYEGLVRIMRFALTVLTVLAATSGVLYLLLGRTVRKGARYEPLD